MRALVVYESMFGSTDEIARAVLNGLLGSVAAELVEVSEAPGAPSTGVIWPESDGLRSLALAVSSSASRRAGSARSRPQAPVAAARGQLARRARPVRLSG